MTQKLFNEFETVKHHSVSDFLLDEEANIPKGRLLSIGSLTIVLACVLGVQDAFAGHRSHSSHSSHSSHRSGVRHSSHISHTSHSSGHYSHSSSYNYHSNVAPAPSIPTPILPSTLKTPQTLPDTIPIE